MRLVARGHPSFRSGQDIPDRILGIWVCQPARRAGQCDQNDGHAEFFGGRKAGGMPVLVHGEPESANLRTGVFQ